VLSKKSVLSAITGVAMLALPAIAFAGHQYDWDDDPQPYAWHDQGCHRGGPPVSYYREEPPAGYNLVQQRDWLLERRRRAYQVLEQMRARHDQRAVHQVATVIRELDGRIARDNQILASGQYLPPPVPYDPAESNPNHANYGYNPGYGYNPNSQSSPGLNALTSMVGPLLGLQSR